MCSKKIIMPWSATIPHLTKSPTYLVSHDVCTDEFFGNENIFEEPLGALAECFSVHVWHVAGSQISLISVGRKYISSTSSNKPTICSLLSTRQNKNKLTSWR